MATVKVRTKHKKGTSKGYFLHFCTIVFSNKSFVLIKSNTALFSTLQTLKKGKTHTPELSKF